MGLASFNRMRRIKAEKARKGKKKTKDIPNNDQAKNTAENAFNALVKKLQSMNVKQLREYATKNGIKNASRKKKAELIRELTQEQEGEKTGDSKD